MIIDVYKYHFFLASDVAMIINLSSSKISISHLRGSAAYQVRMVGQAGQARHIQSVDGFEISSRDIYTLLSLSLKVR